jgi:hypothetical protein
MAPLEIEHIEPLARGGTNVEDNLWLACPICNRHKGSKTIAIDPITQSELPLFNPRIQHWNEHFEWSDDGLRVIGKTPTGRATVIALKLDSDPEALEVRSYWVKAGWHPPKE